MPAPRRPGENVRGLVTSAPVPRNAAMWNRFVLVAVAACGASPRTPADPVDADHEAALRTQASHTAATAEDAYAPLEVGADYLRYRKLTDKPFQSLDHGNRWVDVYVNEIGAAAYLSGAPIPVG